MVEKCTAAAAARFSTFLSSSLFTLLLRLSHSAEHCHSCTYSMGAFLYLQPDMTKLKRPLWCIYPHHPSLAAFPPPKKRLGMALDQVCFNKHFKPIDFAICLQIQLCSQVYDLCWRSGEPGQNSLQFPSGKRVVPQSHAFSSEFSSIRSLRLTLAPYTGNSGKSTWRCTRAQKCHINCNPELTFHWSLVS